MGRLITPKGRELLKAINQEGCDFHSIGKPTYFPSDSNKILDLIDFYIAKGIGSTYLEIEESIDMTSDHKPEAGCRKMASNKKSSR